MATRLPALVHSPIGFAHRGARALERDNTLEAFRLAIRLGATGIESDVWVTADGVPVLDHDGVVGRRLSRRTPISQLNSADLPDHIPTLAEYYGAIDPAVPLSLDVCDPAGFTAVVDVAKRFGALETLWCCSSDLDDLVSWRTAQPTARLVHSVRPKMIETSAERHAATLADATIDAVNMRHDDWTGGLTTLYHRFEVLAFAWDAQYERTLDEVFRIGVDAVYSDYVDRLVESMERFYPR